MYVTDLISECFCYSKGVNEYFLEEIAPQRSGNPLSQIFILFVMIHYLNVLEFSFWVLSDAE